MRLRGPRARELRHAAIACLLVIPTCLCRQISGFDIDDGGQTTLSDAGPDAGPDAGDAGDAGLDAGGDGGLDAGEDAGVDAGPDAGEDAGPDGGPDGGADSGVPPVPDSGVGACGLPISGLTSSVTYPLGSISTPFASADLNGDGLLDLIEGSSPNAGFNVLFGLADGGLSEPIPYDSVTPSPWFAVGDVDGDGSPDLVISSWSASLGLVVFLNDGHGGLTQQPILSTPGVTDGVAIGDLNGDGLADLLANTNDTQTWFWEVFFQLSDGGFSAPSRLDLPSPFDPELIFGDLNGDGLQDLITTTDDEAHVAVFLQQSDGGFEQTLYQAPALGQIGLLPRAGGLPDIVVGETGYQENAAGETVLGIGVMANLGNGTFAEPVTYTIPGGASFAIGDFNGDCIPDIASPSNDQGACQNGWPISVLYGDGDGGFTGPENLNAGEGPGAIAVLGPVDNPRAIAAGDYCGGGVTVYGDASQH